MPQKQATWTIRRIPGTTNAPYVTKERAEHTSAQEKSSRRKGNPFQKKILEMLGFSGSIPAKSKEEDQSPVSSTGLHRRSRRRHQPCPTLSKFGVACLRTMIRLAGHVRSSRSLRALIAAVSPNLLAEHHATQPWILTFSERLFETTLHWHR
jgi:hypothetical protein